MCTGTVSTKKKDRQEKAIEDRSRHLQGKVAEGEGNRLSLCDQLLSHANSYKMVPWNIGTGCRYWKWPETAKGQTRRVLLIILGNLNVFHISYVLVKKQRTLRLFKQRNRITFGYNKEKWRFSFVPTAF